MLSRTVSACVVLVICLQAVDGARVYFDKCEHKGFVCTKSPIFANRQDVKFNCNYLTTWDVEFYLWSWRAPANIASFTITNCTNVTIVLQCTSELKHITSLRVTNVTKLSIPSLIHGLSQSPPEVILEDIQHMDTIFTRTFIQIKKFQFNRFGCVNPSRDLESVELRNVNVGTIEREAFHNLTTFKNLTFDNVTVNTISASAVHVYLDKEAQLKINNCNITLMEYMSFNVRGDKFSIMTNNIKEIQSTAIKTTVNSFEFLNNTIGWVHHGAMSVLASSVRTSDNYFSYLESAAFQAIGPGLPENALKGFGELNFEYEFKNNLIESLEVGSLHPDWRAYKKVGGKLVVNYNALKCTCAELAWLSHKEGFGKEFSTLDEFHAKILDLDNKNLCIDAPCTLPVDAVRHMVLKDGRCLHNLTLKNLCDYYYPPTTIPTKKPIFKPVATTPYTQYFKKASLFKSATFMKSKGYRMNINLSFIVENIVMLVLCKILI